MAGAASSVLLQSASSVKPCLRLSRRQCLFQRQQSGLPRSRGALGVVMMKKDIHPEYYEEAKVFCNGEEVLTTSGTQQKYTVDIWSGNHPFFKGNSSSVVVDEGRVNRFKRRFAGLESMATVAELKGEVDLTKFKKGQAAKKGKGKGKK